MCTIYILPGYVKITLKYSFQVILQAIQCYHCENKLTFKIISNCHRNTNNATNGITTI